MKQNRGETENNAIKNGTEKIKKANYIVLLTSGRQPFFKISGCLKTKSSSHDGLNGIFCCYIVSSKEV